MAVMVVVVVLMPTVFRVDARRFLGLGLVNRLVIVVMSVLFSIS
jgi:hypothetical protein